MRSSGTVRQETKFLVASGSGEIVALEQPPNSFRHRTRTDANFIEASSSLAIGGTLPILVRAHETNGTLDEHVQQVAQQFSLE